MNIAYNELANLPGSVTFLDQCDVYLDSNRIVASALPDSIRNWVDLHCSDRSWAAKQKQN
jgi:hypothetical protein